MWSINVCGVLAGESRACRSIAVEPPSASPNRGLLTAGVESAITNRGAVRGSLPGFSRCAAIRRIRAV